MKRFTKLLLTSLIILSFSFSLNKSTIVFSEEKNISIFTPFSFLQYGPSPDDAIVLYFISSIYLNGDEAVEIYNPHTRINNLTEAPMLVSSDILYPALDSYFLFNRIHEQLIPKVSNFSIEFAPIINSDQVRNHYTQIKTGSPTFLPLDSENNSTKMFSIPSSLKTGYYLVTLTTNLSEYNAILKYSNVVLFADETFTDPLSSLMESNNSLPSTQSSLPDETITDPLSSLMESNNSLPHNRSSLDYSYWNDNQFE